MNLDTFQFHGVIQFLETLNEQKIPQPGSKLYFHFDHDDNTQVHTTRSFQEFWEFQENFRNYVVELFHIILLGFNRSTRWHTQRRCRHFEEIKNSIGLTLHTENRDTDFDLAAKTHITLIRFICIFHYFQSFKVGVPDNTKLPSIPEDVSNIFRHYQSIYSI